MWRFLISRASSTHPLANSSIPQLRSIFFRSKYLSSSELVETTKRISTLTFYDIRNHIGKEDFFKNFFLTLSSKLASMKSEELISIASYLVKNPDFRDYKYTFYIWPTICKLLNNRIESLNLEQTIEVLHTVSFIKINHILSTDLISTFSKRIENFTTKDFEKLPLSSFNNLLWIFGSRKMGTLETYKIIYDTFVRNKDFKHISYDNLSLFYYLFNLNTSIKGIEQLTLPLRECIFEALTKKKTKSIQESIEIVYYLYGAKTHDFYSNEINQELMNLLNETDITSHELIRLTSSNLEWSPEIFELLKKRLLDHANKMTFADLCELLLSRTLIKCPDFIEIIIKELGKREIHSKSMSFSKTEKLINSFFKIDPSYSEGLWTILKALFLKMLEADFINDSLMIKIIRWMVYISKRDQEMLDIFSRRIKELERIPSYHSRNLMNLAILIGICKELRTDDLIYFIDDKLFRNSQIMEYPEMSKTMYFLIRINRLGFEVGELLLKRLSESDVSNVLTEDFSLACYSAVMCGNISFCKRVFTYARTLMNFKNLTIDDTRVGNILKNPGVDFGITKISSIRMAWMLLYMNIIDMKIFNSKIYSLFEDHQLSEEEKTNFSTISSVMDVYHDYLAAQFLSIKCPERKGTQDFLERLDKFIAPIAKDCTFNLIEPEGLTLYEEFKNVANELKLKLDTTPRIIAGNLIPMFIENRPVLFFTKEHYNYQSDGYYTNSKYSDLLGIYKMRSRSLISLGYLPIEIQAGEWKVAAPDRNSFIISLLEANNFK